MLTINEKQCNTVQYTIDIDQSAASIRVDNISYPPCKKGIRPGICVKPAVSHEAGGRV